MAHLTDMFRSRLSRLFARSSFTAHETAAIRWIGTVAAHEDCILIERNGVQQSFRIVFPMKPADLPRALVPIHSNITPTFIVRSMHHSRVAPPEPWKVVFEASFMKVLESTKRPLRERPLRWGLNDSERAVLLDIARQSLTDAVLASGSRAEGRAAGAPARLFQRCDVDVAIWVNGFLRGSIIIEKSELAVAVARGAALATRDLRFKPIVAHELPAVGIEIVLMSSLRIPLPWRGAQGNELHTQKGYVLTDGAHKGWYLPEIFNVRQFTDATEFFTTLASEKAQLARPSPRAQCALFDVEDFIGVATGSAPLSLRGPVIRRDTPDDGGRRMAARAADWIIRHQDEAGHMTPIVHALRDRAPTADWPRQAFATWALAAWARVTGEEAYRSAALRSHRATRGSVVGAARTAASDLVHAYLGKAALELGEAEAARASLTHLQPLILRDPITTAHVLGLARRLLSAADYAASPAPAFEATLMAQFRNDRSQPDTELALHAELGALLLDATPEDAGEVLAWMAGMQRKDGSFPRAARSLLRYTRGTGKVFEVLALDPEHYRASIVSCLTWLSSMQYAEDNLFFVPIERRPKLAGGFRHDDNNPDAWVDAAAHVILGVSRLIAGGRNTA